MTPDVPPRTGRLRLALVVLSLFLFVWTVREGQASGLDRVLPEPIEKHESCVAVAVSDLRHGHKGGYTAFRAVRAELQLNGWTWNTDILRQTGLSYPDNMTATDRLDEGLARAASLPNADKDGVDPLPIFAEDVGYSDFAKLGFAVFGYRLSSLYAAYFLVLGTGLGLYLVAHRRDVPMLLLLVGFQIALFLLVRALPTIGTYEVASQTRFQLGTLTNGRFLGTLGLIPFFHLAACLLTWPRATPGRVALAAGQAGLLALALHFRGSVLWMFAALFVIAGSAAAAWLWRNRRGLSARTYTVGSAARSGASRWPVLLVALALVAQKEYVSSATHWTYQADDGLPNHLVWHSALLGLEYHPGWRDHPLFPGASTDELAWTLVQRKIAADGIDTKYHVSPITGAYKARFHDRMCRDIYLEFVRKNPRYTAELMLWYKPKRLWEVTREDWRWIRPGIARPDTLAVLAVFAGCLIAAGRGRLDGWRVAAGVAVVGCVGSTLPFFWAYPQFSVMNEFLILTGLSVGVGVLVAARVALRARFPRRVWSVRLPGMGARVTN